MTGLFATSDIIIAGSALVVMVMFMLWGQSQKQSAVRKRIARMKSRKHNSPRASALDALSLRRKNGQELPPLIALLLKPFPKLEGLSIKLRRAGYTIDAQQFLLRGLLAMAVMGGITALLGKSFFLGFSVGFLLMIWLPIKLVNRKLFKQRAKFLKIFPDGIDLIVRGLRSGLPVSESIVVVANEVPEPVASTFMRITNTMKLGVPMEKAMQDAARELDYTEFNFFVTSIILQRETGGNLGEILANLSDVLRKRLMMQMKVHALTSEARASAIIVGALPFFVMGAVMLLSPHYLEPMWNDLRGNKAALVAAGFFFMGFLTMRRLARFEI